jgi:uncharacterized protein (DUF1330 family)
MDAQQPATAPRSHADPTGYVVIHLNVLDAPGIRRYLTALKPILASFGADFLFQLRPLEQIIEAPFSPQLDAWCDRPGAHLGVIRFTDRDQIRAWFDSEEYNAGPKELLKASADVDMRVFEDAHPVTGVI